MKKNENNHINAVSFAILRNMEENLIEVQDALNLNIDSLIKIINRETEKDKEKIICTMINNQLEQLNSITINELNEVQNNVELLMSYYVLKKDNYDLIIKKGNYIANQILLKIIDGTIKIPINISTLKKTFSSAKIDKKKFYDIFIWVILRYVAIERCISFSNWIKEFKNNIEG